MSKAAAIRLTALALAAATALVVFGCGGGSATETTGSSPSPSSSSAAGGGGGKAGQGPTSSQAGEDAASAVSSKGANPKAAAKDPGPGSAAGGKQGPVIAQPKGPREPEPTAKERSEATVASMTLTSPALSPGPESVSPLPATYTCDGKDTWPTLRWSGVPSGSAELVLFALNLEPVSEALFFDWAVAGLSPGLTEIKSGALPKGAVLGKNGFGKRGYSICPNKSPETVIFALYALPKGLSARAGFDPAALRKEVLAVSGNAGLLATSYGHG